MIEILVATIIYAACAAVTLFIFWGLQLKFGKIEDLDPHDWMVRLLRPEAARTPTSITPEEEESEWNWLEEREATIFWEKPGEPRRGLQLQTILLRAPELLGRGEPSSEPAWVRKMRLGVADLDASDRVVDLSEVLARREIYKIWPGSVIRYDRPVEREESPFPLPGGSKRLPN